MEVLSGLFEISGIEGAKNRFGTKKRFDNSDNFSE